MKKRPTNKPTPIDDLAVLAKIASTKEWPVLAKIIRSSIQYEKEKVIRLQEYNPVKLAVDKSRHMGIVSGLLMVIHDVENAAAEMEKLATKETE